MAMTVSQKKPFHVWQNARENTTRLIYGSLKMSTPTDEKLVEEVARALCVEEGIIPDSKVLNGGGDYVGMAWVLALPKARGALLAARPSIEEQARRKALEEAARELEVDNDFIAAALVRALIPASQKEEPQ
jgi:hypothetical protein